MTFSFFNLKKPKIMKEINIIRVQDKEGLGFFYSEKDVMVLNPILSNVYNRHFTIRLPSYVQFPTPCHDFDKDGNSLNIYKNKRNWFCAFKTLEQFNSLIKKEEAKEFVKEGFDILLLTVSEYQEGVHQVLFLKESITKTENLNSLFE